MQFSPALSFIHLWTVFFALFAGFWPGIITDAKHFGINASSFLLLRRRQRVIGQIWLKRQICNMVSVVRRTFVCSLGQFITRSPVLCKLEITRFRTKHVKTITIYKCYDRILNVAGKKRISLLLAVYRRVCRIAKWAADQSPSCNQVWYLVTVCIYGFFLVSRNTVERRSYFIYALSQFHRSIW